MIAKTNNDKATAPVVPVSHVSLDEALKAFAGLAVVATESLTDMCLGGALVYVHGYWCAPNPDSRIKMDVITERLAASLKAANPTKGESTLRAYLATCKALYSHIVDPAHYRAFGPVIAHIASAKTTHAAHDVLKVYLKSKGVHTLDGLKEFVGLVGSNTQAKTRTAGDAITAALKNMGASIGDGKAKPEAMATVIANAIPVDKGVTPAMLVREASKRIVKPDEAMAAATDAAMHLANIDLDAFDAFVVKMGKVRDAMLKAAPKANKAAKKETQEGKHA